MKMKKVFINMVGTCLFLASVFISSDASAQEKLVAFYSPPAGGGAYTLVAGEVMVSNRYMGGGVKFVHEQTTGTMEMVRRLMTAESQKKDAFASFGSTDGYNAYKGRQEYSGKPFTDLRAVVFNQLVDLYLAVPVNSPIKTYADVRGKRIAMGDRAVRLPTQRFSRLSSTASRRMILSRSISFTRRRSKVSRMVHSTAAFLPAVIPCPPTWSSPRGMQSA